MPWGEVEEDEAVARIIRSAINAASKGKPVIRVHALARAVISATVEASRPCSLKNRTVHIGERSYTQLFVAA